MKAILHTDGGARGNPGPGAAGAVILDTNHKVIKEIGTYLGVCTNNEAEYKALIIGLTCAKDLNISEISCFLDSELVVKQLNGLYKVKNPNMKKLFTEATKLVQAFDNVKFTHVRRENNSHADKLVNEVLDASQ